MIAMSQGQLSGGRAAYTRQTGAATCLTNSAQALGSGGALTASPQLTANRKRNGSTTMGYGSGGNGRQITPTNAATGAGHTFSYLQATTVNCESGRVDSSSSMS